MGDPSPLKILLLVNMMERRHPFEWRMQWRTQDTNLKLAGGFGAILVPNEFNDCRREGKVARRSHRDATYMRFSWPAPIEAIIKFSVNILKAGLQKASNVLLS